MNLIFELRKLSKKNVNKFHRKNVNLATIGRREFCQCQWPSKGHDVKACFHLIRYIPLKPRMLSRQKPDLWPFMIRGSNVAFCQNDLWDNMCYLGFTVHIWYMAIGSFIQSTPRGRPGQSSVVPHPVLWSAGDVPLLCFGVPVAGWSVIQLVPPSNTASYLTMTDDRHNRPHPIYPAPAPAPAPVPGPRLCLTLKPNLT